MLHQHNANSNETSSSDQDKYQLSLDAVIKQMNLLSNDPDNETLRLAHEQARQRFIQISNIEKDEYEKFIYSKLPSISSQNLKDRIHHIEEPWLHNIENIYICYFILIIVFMTLTVICIIIAIK